MAFGDRGRYKAVATALYELLPEFNPTIEAFPASGSVSGFPAVAVAFHPDGQSTQLLWLSNKLWKWKLVVIDGTGRSHVTDDDGHGPSADELPLRWALAGTLDYYDRWLRDDQGGASAARVRASNMHEKVKRLSLT